MVSTRAMTKKDVQPVLRLVFTAWSVKDFRGDPSGGRRYPMDLRKIQDQEPDWGPLAAFNAERSRGTVHPPEYVGVMEGVHAGSMIGWPNIDHSTSQRPTRGQCSCGSGAILCARSGD